MNTSKLVSYFSQLFGELIQNVQSNRQSEDNSQRIISFDTEVAGEFGLETGSTKF